MPIDRSAAETFIWSTARLVDRHRYAFLFTGGPPEPVIEALRGYRNRDGGFGHGLEPDLRDPTSQPAATLYALEILNEAGAGDHHLARDARAWVASVAEADGGIRAALPGFEGYPHAPWWTGLSAAEEGSFLTMAFAAAFFNAGVTGEGWLEAATEWSWQAIESTEEPGGYWLKYALAFLDAVPDAERAASTMDALAKRVDPSMMAPVGGAEGEVLRPLDLSPRPGTRSRDLVGPDRIAAHLDRVESEQQADGGWMFDWLAWSPAQTNDWRGNVTIRALKWLHDHGRL